MRFESFKGNDLRSKVLIGARIDPCPGSRHGIPLRCQHASLLCLYARLDGCDDRLLCIGWQQQCGCGQVVIEGYLSGFQDVVEETVQLIVVLLRDGIVLMVMASRTAE